MKRDNKGITLIALVITIIVLIILAAVSINLLLGENGIIERARQAAEDYKKAAEDEQLALKELEGYIDAGEESSNIKIVVTKEPETEITKTYVTVSFEIYENEEKQDVTQGKEISYEEYAQKILSNSTPEEINDMFYNALIYMEGEYIEHQYPGQEITKDFIAELLEYNSYEELLEEMISYYGTLEAGLIEMKCARS